MPRLATIDYTMFLASSADCNLCLHHYISSFLVATALLVLAAFIYLHHSVASFDKGPPRRPRSRLWFHTFPGMDLPGVLRDIPLAWESIDRERYVAYGDLYSVGAQLLQSLQFVVEERLLQVLPIPAPLVVGLEGAAGLMLITLLAPIVRGKVPMQESKFSFLPSALMLLKRPQLAVRWGVMRCA